MAFFRFSKSAEKAAPPAEEFVITEVPTSHASDLYARRKKYVISMSIRIACLIAIFFVPVGWPQILLAIGAIFIPYIAVVGANAGGELIRAEPLSPPQDPQLAAANTDKPSAQTHSMDEPLRDTDPQTDAAHPDGQGPQTVILEAEPLEEDEPSEQGNPRNYGRGTPDGGHV